MRENNYNHVDKKARFEVEQEEMLQQYQDPRGEEEDPQLQAFLHQQRLIRQQQHQQTLQSMSPYQVRLLQLQQQQQQQIRRQLQQQQGPHQIHSFEDGVCTQKFMMFLYHIKQRPADNCITFWRGFVAGYFSPRAKQRLCLSHYKKGMFPPAASDVWQCNLCGTKSGKGVEATYDVLARLFEVKFSSGIVDELLSLDYPREYRVSNGKMVLEYRKVVQHTVYEQCRVVHEGPLRIIFSPDLKILSWEFCARRHEEFLVRRVIAPQVNQLLDVTQKFQSTISESGSSEGVSQKDLQTNSNIVLGEGRKLAKVMELESLNDHGYPKKYVRALQTYEVLKSTKDLMDFTFEHKIGPIEGLKRLSEQRARMQEMEQLGNNGAMIGTSAQAHMNGTTGNNSNNHCQNVGRGAMNDSAQAAASLSNNQSMFMNNIYSTTGTQEGFPSQRQTPYSNQSPYLSQQRQNLATGGFPSSPEMQQQQRTMHATPNTLQQTHSHHLLQPPHSHGLDQELQQMFENLPNLQQKQVFSGQSGGNSNAKRKPTAFSRGGRVPSRNNSTKTASNNNPHLSGDATQLPDDISDDKFLNDSDE
ncbi:probable transcriptional regulator SLK1 [Raphanus sativus]|uniref:Probable transcriptional regulator SLK1 n=1 Tax=Raphanus sativus TaxID=3726 RepID=A0A9W3DGP4_RAPSA|nr:probable transcriptional regulator SLK1 [Raphanus sativus]XP_056863072.1 probable transcriptional regulator SLK1 [Raphanus sativus]XP_056863073.1 probable transcriptional regulator SLK1 [Raphanus sativus]XP_056863074.1 probable transcriptional regulator SLK1 [Raphanus sativus]